MTKPNLARSILPIFVALVCLLAASQATLPAIAAPAFQDPPPSDTPTNTNVPPTSTTTPTPTITPTPTQNGNRPLVLIESYSTSVDTVTPGQDFTIYLTLQNHGSSNAVNILLAFTPGDLLPRQTGGSVTLSQLVPGEKKTVSQPVTANTTLSGNSISNLILNITYNDQASGAAYTGAFNLAFHINYPVYAPAAPTKTPTPVAVSRPQLTITGYGSDTEPLQPGMTFKLSLEVRNLGNAPAKGVTMILGGGTGSGGGSSGTQVPGGVSGASGEFTNFAPLQSSNIHFIGDVPQGQSFNIDQPLIVNVTTNPGAYSVKISFVYVDEHGTQFTDDQVITLLVYQLPLVDVTFYRDPGPFFVGQPGPLPIQITNLSRKPTVLGNMKASISSGGQITNNVTLVGAMDPGGYFTLDANLIPEKAGPVDVDVTISYTDDFNQPKTVHQMLHVEVQEMTGGEGMNGMNGGVPGGKPGEIVNPGSIPAAPESFADKLLRFLKGMIGLDSGVPQPVNSGGQQGIPSKEGPSQPIIQPAPPILKGG